MSLNVYFPAETLIGDTEIYFAKNHARRAHLRGIFKTQPGI